MDILLVVFREGAQF